MKLETERLILRAPSLDDAEKMFSNWCSDPEVTKYLTWLPHENIEMTKIILNRFVSEENDPKTHRGFITLKDSGEPIGCIDVVNYHDDDNPEIGYCLSRKYWNQGIMTEACSAFINHLFDQGFSKIYICANVANIGSNRVIEKCGFKFLCEEHRDHCSIFKSEPVDLNCYELSKTIIGDDVISLTRLDSSMCHDIWKNSLDKNNRRFVPDEVFETLKETKEVVKSLMDSYINKDGPFVYAVIRNSDKANMGYVQLVRIEEGWEIGYHIAEQYCGNGYATKAASLFLKYLKENNKLDIIYGVALKDNKASRKVLEKNGFKLIFDGVGPYQGKDRKIVKYIKEL